MHADYKSCGASVERVMPVDIAKWSEILLNIVKCVGIGVAGYWALFKFDLTEAPNYAPTLALSSNASQGKMAEACKFQLSIQITNNYNVPVKIDGVAIKLWLFDFPLPKKTVTFVDFRDLEKESPAWQLPTGADKELSFTYYPHQQANYGYDILLLNPDKNYAYYKIRLDSKTSDIANNVFDTKYIQLRC